MLTRHVTHLIDRYVQGQLRPAQRARVINHVRACARCRAALAREERLAADLRRELPRLGQPSAAQIDRVWAEVSRSVQPVSARSRRLSRRPGLGMALALLVVIALALPLLAQKEMRAEAALFDPGSNVARSTASPAPGASGEARTGTPAVAGAAPRATVALALAVGASPAPVPVSTLVPKAPTDAAGW